LTQKTILVCADNAGPIKFFGPISQPTRHPVVPKVLPPLPTVMVRSHAPGRLAIRS